MYEGVELGVGVILVSSIHILLSIVKSNNSAKRKRAEKWSLPVAPGGQSRTCLVNMQHALCHIS